MLGPKQNFALFGFMYFFLVCLTLTSTSYSFAQSVNLDTRQAKLLKKATKANNAEQIEDAIALYERVIAYKAVNVAHLGLGRALQKVGRCEDAESQFMLALNSPVVTSPSPQIVEAAVLKFRSESKTLCNGTLRVTCEDNLTAIKLDDRPLVCGEAVSLKAGTYSLQTSLNNNSNTQQVTVVGMGEQVLHSNLTQSLSQENVSEVASPVTPESARGILSTTGIVTFAVGGVMTLTGVGFGLKLNALNGDIEDMAARGVIEGSTADSLMNEATATETLHHVTLGLGLAALITGTTLWLVDGVEEGGDTSTKSTQFYVRPNKLGVGARLLW